jgi:uncharacterized membrane protein YwzB
MSCVSPPFEVTVPPKVTVVDVGVVEVGNVTVGIEVQGAVVAVLFIIIGGFWYMTSAGNENQARKGRDTLLYALLGTIVIIMSYVIVSFVVTAVS